MNSNRLDLDPILLGKAFGIGVPGALDALMRPPLVRAILPDHLVQMYGIVAVDALERNLARSQSRETLAQTTLCIQGLRLLILEKLFIDRELKSTPQLRFWLSIVKRSPTVTALLAEKGILVHDCAWNEQ